jgi:Viral BACON domain
LRKFKRLTELFTVAAVVLLGHPDTARSQTLTFSQNPVTLSITGPGSTSQPTTLSVSSTVQLTGSLQVTTINTSDRTNWLCAQPNGTSLTLTAGTGCSGATTNQLSNNQTYTAQVTVTAASSSGTLTGQLNVNLQVGATSGLVPSQNPVFFNVQTGGTAPPQNVGITLNGTPVTVQNVSASTNTGQNWLLPSVGASSVLVSVNATGLSSGTYTGTVTANTTGGQLTFGVNLTVSGIPTLNASPMTLNFAYQTGTAAPLPQTISLTTNGTPVNVSVSSSTNSGGAQWLIVTPTGQVTTPTQITVNIQPTGLVAGNYSGSIQINSSGGATNGVVSIPVNLLVSNNAIISANPGSLTFTAQAGGAAPAQQQLSLTSSGAALAYTVSSNVTTPGGGTWLQVPTQSGTTSGTVAVAINTAGLAVGTYTGSISVTAPNAGNGNLSVPVTLNITAGPVLQLSVPSLSFAYQTGQAQPLNQTIAIGSASGQVTFSAAPQTAGGQQWLTVSPTSGVAPGNIVVGVNTAGLTAGTYNGSILITSSGASSTPQTVQVTLVVSDKALFVLSPSAATFTASVGSTASSFQPLAVTSTDGTLLGFSVSTNTTTGSNWLLVNSAIGTTPANLSIAANPAGLAVGTYTGTVTITATSGTTVANSPQTFPVTLNVTSTNTIGVSSSSLTFSTNGNPPAAQTINVTSSAANSGAQITFADTVSLNQGQNWLTVTPSNATTPATLTVTANGAGLAAGTYTGQIILSSPGVASQTVNVTLNVGSVAGFSSAGSMAQLASAGLWKTSFTLVNNGTTPAQVHLNFFDDGGNPLSLPLTFPQTPSAASPATMLDRTINPGATLLIESTGPDDQKVQVGWSQLLTNGDISGFAIFRQAVGASNQEAVVPLEIRNASSYVLPFDNTSGYASGVALANVATQPANIGVVFKDDTGTILRSDSITLPAQGHTSFDLATRFAITAQKRGTVEFDTPQGGQISVLGLRFNPTGAFSTVPALTK